MGRRCCAQALCSFEGAGPPLHHGAWASCGGGFSSGLCSTWDPAGARAGTHLPCTGRWFPQPLDPQGSLPVFTQGKRGGVHVDLRKPHVTLQTGCAPFGGMGWGGCGGGGRFVVCFSVYGQPPLQLGSADHVSVWPLSPGELLGALHSVFGVTGC